MSKLRHISIQEAQQGDEYSAVYAINTIQRNERGSRERVFISVPKDGQDGSDLLLIPNTTLPIDLTSMVSRGSIFRSSDFRKAVRFGMITLVNAEDAERILSTPEAKRDLAALMEAEQVNTMADRNDVIDGSENLSNVREIDNSHTARNQVLELGASGVNPNVESVMESAEGNTEGNVINSIRNIPNKTLADYRYILEKAREHNFDDLAGRIEKKIAKLTAEDDNEL